MAWVELGWAEMSSRRTNDTWWYKSIISVNRIIPWNVFKYSKQLWQRCIDWTGVHAMSLVSRWFHIGSAVMESRTWPTRPRPRPRPRTIEIVLEDPRGQRHVLEDSITADQVVELTDSLFGYAFSFISMSSIPKLWIGGDTNIISMQSYECCMRMVWWHNAVTAFPSESDWDSNCDRI